MLQCCAACAVRLRSLFVITFTTSVQTAHNKAGATWCHKAFPFGPVKVTQLLIGLSLWLWVVKAVCNAVPVASAPSKTEILMQTITELSVFNIAVANPWDATVMLQAVTKPSDYATNHSFLLSVMSQLHENLSTHKVCCRQSQSPSTMPLWMKWTHCWLTAAEILSSSAQPPLKTWTGLASQRR